MGSNLSLNQQINFKGKENKPKDYMFSSNPIVDAAITGGIGAVAGAGISTYQQVDTFHSPKKIEQLEKTLQECKADGRWDSKYIQDLEKDLAKVKAKKICWNKIGGSAFLFGVVLTFLPTLAFNLLFAGGKKVYEGVAQKNN